MSRVPVGQPADDVGCDDGQNHDGHLAVGLFPGLTVGLQILRPQGAQFAQHHGVERHNQQEGKGEAQHQTVQREGLHPVHFLIARPVDGARAVVDVARVDKHRDHCASGKKKIILQFKLNSITPGLNLFIFLLLINWKDARCWSDGIWNSEDGSRLFC